MDGEKNQDTTACNGKSASFLSFWDTLPKVVGACAALIIAGTGAGFWAGHTTAQSSSQRGPQVGSASMVTANISIYSPENGEVVNRCIDLKALGTIPAGFGLWVALEGKEKRYFFVEAVEESPGHWAAPVVIGGSHEFGNATVENISLEVADPIMDNYLKDFALDIKGLTQWNGLRAVPPGLQQVGDSVTVTRNTSDNC